MKFKFGKILMALTLVILYEQVNAVERQTEDQRTLALIASRSLDELNRTDQAFERLKQEQAGCRGQLKAQTVPSSCFEVVKLEEELTSMSSLKRQRLLKFLAERCQVAAKKVTEPGRIQEYLQVSSLAQECRRDLKGQLEILLYRDEESRPSRFFEYWLTQP